VASPTKAELRSAILAARRRLSPQTHDVEAEALCAHLADAVGDAKDVCAYVPTKLEPGSISLLDTLLQLGTRVLLPVARSDADGIPQPMAWALYEPGRLVAAPMGLFEPEGPPLPGDALAGASVVFVPALAVDRRGVRLGRGAGFYDRTLPSAARSARLVAVVRDDEVLDEVPADPHDVPMTHALTPGHGLVRLG
jgi:5-formyltetrahydrofolate cyclo-ligase